MNVQITDNLKWIERALQLSSPNRLSRHKENIGGKGEWRRVCSVQCLHREERIQVKCWLHDSALLNTLLILNITGKWTRGNNDRKILLTGSPSKRQQAGRAGVVWRSAYIPSAQRPGRGSRSFCRVEAHEVVTNRRLYTQEGIPAPGRLRLAEETWTESGWSYNMASVWQAGDWCMTVNSSRTDATPS